MLSDFGNFSGTSKYAELTKIVPHSEVIHAKAMTDDDGLPNDQEFQQCMAIVKQSGYEGPVVLVYDGPHDMWDGIDRIKNLVLPYLAYSWF
jgi:hypothetical protein